MIFNNHFNKRRNKLLWYELIKCDIKCIEIHGSSEAKLSLFSLSTLKSKTNKDCVVEKRGRHRKNEMIEMGCLKARKYLWLLIKLKAILNVLRVVWGKIELAWGKWISKLLLERIFKDDELYASFILWLTTLELLIRHIYDIIYRYSSALEWYISMK